MMADRSTKPWFAPKRFGFGSSLPIAWQGWATMAGFLALIVIARAELHGVARIAAIALLIAAFVIVCALKTDGGWRWRWGDQR